MYKLTSFVMTLLFLAVGIVLGVLNPQVTELNLFLIKLSVPLSLVLASVFVLGAVLGGLVLLVEVAKLKWKLRKQVSVNQKQLNQIVQLKKDSVQEKSRLASTSNVLIHKEK